MLSSTRHMFGVSRKCAPDFKNCVCFSGFLNICFLISCALFQNHLVAICSWWGGKIKKATYKALTVRNGAMCW